MENPSKPSAAAPAGIITQRQYDEYAANWVAASSDPAGADLAQSFRLPGREQLLASLSFPMLQIARLVSAVGVVRVKARFLIIHDEANKQPHFTLALFAVDALDARISSYYLADEYWKPAPQAAAELEKDAGDADSVLPRNEGATPAKTEIPRVLATYWLAAWANLKQVTPALFATTYGPLRGYTFELNDFILPLRQLRRLGSNRLLVKFDLHEYYRPKSFLNVATKATAPADEATMTEGQRTDLQDDELISTFGLMLQLEGGKGMEGKFGDDPVYDMGGPCPPVC